MKKNIAIFASGGGSNAEEIIRHFKNVESAVVALIVSNNPNAFVLERAKNHNIPVLIHTTADLENGSLVAQLQPFNLKLIVLAGYLKRISPDLIEAYPKRIINIHPALLPKFGGKGMYGINVHRAVVAAKERKSGITIHYVNENYDEGSIIEQHQTLISKDSAVELVAEKVLLLEHKYYPRCIEMLLHKFN